VVLGEREVNQTLCCRVVISRPVRKTFLSAICFVSFANGDLPRRKRSQVWGRPRAQRSVPSAPNHEAQLPDATEETWQAVIGGAAASPPSWKGIQPGRIWMGGLSGVGRRVFLGRYGREAFT
jgi:hypothetical protein